MANEGPPAPFRSKTLRSRAVLLERAARRMQAIADEMDVADPELTLYIRQAATFDRAMRWLTGFAERADESLALFQGGEPIEPESD